MKKAKAAYNRRLIVNSGNDHRAFWKTLKKVLPGEQKVVSLIVDSFNKFFTSTVIRLVQAVQNTCASEENSMQFPDQVRDYPDFKFKDVSEDFVRSQLRNLKPGKAVGLDNIPSRLLIDAAVIVAKPLTQINNLSLQSGTVPKDWKAARVVPLF